jgi:hypothetical protein
MPKNFHQSTQHQLPEDNIHHGFSREDPKCHIIICGLFNDAASCSGIDLEGRVNPDTWYSGRDLNHRPLDK